MANRTAEFNADLGRGVLEGASRKAKAASRSASPGTGAVLAPGEADAHPPQEAAHWDLGPRIALIASLAVLSWAAVGAAVFFLLHH